ncbi:MAG: ABC transporter permease, partial [Paracoccaceae bacterium]
VLLGVALALGHGAMRLARWRRVRGRPALRLALAAVGDKRSEAVPVVLSLGLGLAVLAAVGQIDWNLRAAIGSQLPRVAPTFFFIDIQNDQIDGFRQRTTADPAISRVQTSPMLRGIISRIKGRPAREIAGDHWVVTGDRGVTFAASMPQGTKLTAGKWWPADYAGPPLVSFAEEEAREIGLDVGDTLTVNILGRDIEATIASLRVVDFSTAGIGFVLAMNPSAVAGAPHTHIATVYMAPGAEAELLRDVGTAWPNITAIRVREAIERVAGVLRSLAAATSVAALATLLTGFVVLVGASAAGEQARTYEAAILSTLGASKGRILWSFTLRAALMGAAAGLVAITAGGLAGWAVMRFVMDGAYMFEPVSAVAVVGGGALVTVLAGLLFALRPLASPPAQVLRARE